MTYAENVNYWKTGKSSPDTWLEKAKTEIKRVGGVVAGSVIVSDDLTGRAGFMLAFQLGDDQFKMVWPVLKTKTDNLKAARIQAATALYHEVKAACVKLKFLGARSAFFAYLLLDDGRTASEVGGNELAERLPQLLLSEGE
jgi:hypothetical protein